LPRLPLRNSQTNEKVALLQKKHLIKHATWLEDDEAEEVLKKNHSKEY
jgi:hypothetical protein